MEELSMGKWWRQKSGQAKAITALAVLLTLQIGLCFSTPVTVLPVFELFMGPNAESELGWGLIIWQFIFCMITLALIVIATVWWIPGLSSGKKKSRKDTND
jgi:branched-subunit amino acid permease